MAMDTVEDLRKALDDGSLNHISRATFHKSIEAVAKNIRRDNETEAQSYTRAITETEVGKLLFQAHQNASLLKVAPASGFSSNPEPPPNAIQDNVRGPAHRQMHSLAIDYQRSRGNTYEQAYAHVYSHRDNADLREKVKAEHLSNAMAMAGEPGAAAPLRYAQQGGVDAGSSSERWPADSHPGWKS